MRFVYGKKPRIIGDPILIDPGTAITPGTYWVHAEFTAQWDPLLLVPAVAENKLRLASEKLLQLLTDELRITYDGELIYAYLDFDQFTLRAQIGAVIDVYSIHYIDAPDKPVTARVILDLARQVYMEYVPFREETARIFLCSIKIARQAGYRAPAWATGEPVQQPARTGAGVVLFIGALALLGWLWLRSRR